MSQTYDPLIEAIRWNDQGLIPAIAQDAASHQVLMLAWMDSRALQATLEKGEAVYWSRSKQRLWHKGESSGHTQKIIDIRLDCDADTLLLLVEQRGGIACHTGRASCFYRQNQADQGWVSVEAPLKDPEAIYSKDR